MDRFLPQGDLKFPHEAQDPREHEPQDSTQV